MIFENDLGPVFENKHETMRSALILLCFFQYIYLNKNHMKKTLLQLFIILFAAKVSAQTICSVTLFPSPGHVKITNSQTLNGTGTVYWLCSGITVTVNSSSGSTYLLEQNVHLVINGTSGDAVFAKPNCTVTNNSSQGISVTSNTTNVIRNNTSTGMIVDIFCSNVTYDYSLVGGGPCAAATSVLENNKPLFTIHPNPVSIGEPIKINSDITNETELEIIDVSGKTILSEKGEIKNIDTHKLLPGIYFLQIRSNGSTQRTKICIQ